MRQTPRLPALAAVASAIVLGGCYSNVVRREVVFVEPARPVNDKVADNTRPRRNAAVDRVPTRKVKPPPSKVVVDRTKPDEKLPPPDRDEDRDDSRPEQLHPSIGDVLTVAHQHLGQNAVRVNGVTFRYDCSGFVRGAFSSLGVDLMALGAEYPDLNGVGLIYNYLDRFGANHRRKVPRVGEVVYFDDTWDKNQNGLLDDPLTHIGIVDGVDGDGTFYVIHKAGRGIVRDPMNALRPEDNKDENGKIINGFLRPKTKKDPDGTPHVMGGMWAGFGTLSTRAPSIVARNGGGTPSFGATAASASTAEVAEFLDFANGFEPEPKYDGVVE